MVGSISRESLRLSLSDQCCAKNVRALAAKPLAVKRPGRAVFPVNLRAEGVCRSVPPARGGRPGHGPGAGSGAAAMGHWAGIRQVTVTSQLISTELNVEDNFYKLPIERDCRGKADGSSSACQWQPESSLAPSQSPQLRVTVSGIVLPASHRHRHDSKHAGSTTTRSLRELETCQ